MFPEGRNDSPKDIEVQGFDSILKHGEGIHVVPHYLLIPWKYVGHHLSFSNRYLGSKGCKFQHQISYQWKHHKDLN